jgi:hypothetical protein
MLDKFFQQIERAQSGLDLRPGEECFYRGHSNSEWPLLPSLLRHCQAVRLKGNDVRDHMPNRATLRSTGRIRVLWSRSARPLLKKCSSRAPSS